MNNYTTLEELMKVSSNFMKAKTVDEAKKLVPSYPQDEIPCEEKEPTKQVEEIKQVEVKEEKTDDNK